ncbi:thioredoxin domain-containing protein [Scandinavium goeteborgense]|uniref:thioredoxin domain-containing protein n=1 Tax=Scandinavium goeteborgense TaxID=1851514 RepID=UPI003824BF99
MILKYPTLATIVAFSLFSVAVLAADPIAKPVVSASTGASSEQASIHVDAKIPLASALTTAQTAQTSVSSADTSTSTLNPQSSPVDALSQQQDSSTASSNPPSASHMESVIVNASSENASTKAIETSPDKNTEPSNPPSASHMESVIVNASSENASTKAIETSPDKNTEPSNVTFSVPPVSKPAPVFTSEQEKQIGEVGREYLLAHPEILLEVSRKLQIMQREQQDRAMAKAVLEHLDVLLNDKSTPSYGPTDAKVAVIEFFDYQCLVCVQQASVLNTLMKANPQVRYIFKEWPIFSSRWENSMTAAQTGLQIWLQNGADAYLSYHNAIFATGHNEGKLTLQDIHKASRESGKLKGNKSGMLDLLVQNDILALSLGFRGAPGLIVLPITGASEDNITVILGGANQDALETSIEKASRQ